MKRVVASLFGAICVMASVFAQAPAHNLRSEFQSPPASAKPWVYWFWLNGNITREGITADLEAMQRAGIGGVLIMEVDQGVPQGPVDFMSDSWRDLFKHVVLEAGRLGLEVNMNNDAGWNGSGGPWIQPEQSMQKVVWTEVEIEGPRAFDGTLAQPETIAGFYRDIAVLAFPSPGPYRIDNIELKACYRAGFVPPSIPPEIPAEMVVSPDAIVDLSDRLAHDGSLEWEAPPGKWTIMRLGHTSTGVENAPAPATGRGLECDKLSKEGIEANFNGMIGKLIEDAGPDAGPVFSATHIDSWENGAQNWTARMRDEFARLRGYDLLPYLPTLSGRVVGSLGMSERFLWDFRQTISDLLVENYAGHLRTLANRHGMRLSIEPYGGPCDDLVYASQADEPMGEFWVGGNALSVCKGMASAAHVYGKPILGAEAFTADNSERWLAHPATIKALGDKAFCLGVNRFVVHRYALQPWLDRAPGMTMGPWGVHYERTQTWWEMAGPWHDYVARCQHMLRQGLFVADICYLQAEAAPQGSQEHHRAGYDFDNCSADAVLTRMSVKDGRLVMPDGMSYRVLALPHVPTMTPALARKIRNLVQSGATVLGPRPQKSPSLSGYPACDDEVASIANELWADCDGVNVRVRQFGAGRVVCGMTPEALLAADGLGPDFSSWKRLDYIHRVDGADDIYFVANPSTNAVTATCVFRNNGKPPEIWQPDTGEMLGAGITAYVDGGVSVVLSLEPYGSTFVVFRDSDPAPDSVISIARNGEALLSAIEVAPRITIRSAVYGVLDDPARTRDVREKVQQRIDAGEFSFSVARLAEGDDPAPNVLKSAVVEYSVGDHVFSVTGNDHDSLHLTDATNKIVVEKAIYGVPGDPARTRDVRDKLQHILDTGEMSFQVARMAQGDDPAVGVVKTLDLTYTEDGRTHTAKGTDAERLVLYEPTGAEQIVVPAADAIGAPTLEFRRGGEYILEMQSGASRRVVVENLPAPLTLPGPWNVAFNNDSGNDIALELDTLESWTEFEDPAVRYHSGSATYTTRFDTPADLLREERQLYLDLGEVGVIARVALNGDDLGILWKPPFRVNVSKSIRAGENTLEVEVVNLWVNRLIGDEQLPDDSERYDDGSLKQWPDWLLKGEPSPTGRRAFTTWRLWKADDPLQPSGLLGPVTIQATAVVKLDQT